MAQIAASEAARQRRAKVLIGAGVIAVAVLGLVTWAMGRPGSTAYYVSASELPERAASSDAGAIRLTGRVLPGSIEKDGLRTSFVVTDGQADVRVTTAQPLPDAFRERSEVVATGTYGEGRFSASQVLAKCPSKFKAKA